MNPIEESILINELRQRNISNEEIAVALIMHGKSPFDMRFSTATEQIVEATMGGLL